MSVVGGRERNAPFAEAFPKGIITPGGNCLTISSYRVDIIVNFTPLILGEIVTRRSALVSAF
jgi:hypothetical protein